jgi:hypothetical protein
VNGGRVARRRADGGACVKKMSVCGTVQQQTPLVFTVVDNLNRPSVRISYIVREGGSLWTGSAT